MNAAMTDGFVKKPAIFEKNFLMPGYFLSSSLLI